MKRPYECFTIESIRYNCLAHVSNNVTWYINIVVYMCGVLRMSMRACVSSIKTLALSYSYQKRWRERQLYSVRHMITPLYLAGDDTLFLLRYSISETRDIYQCVRFPRIQHCLIANCSSLRLTCPSWKIPTLRAKTLAKRRQWCRCM